VAAAGFGVFDQQAGIEHRLVLQGVAAQVLHQVVPARRRKAEAEVPGDHAGQAAALEVFHRGLAGWVALERLPIVPGGGIEQRIKWRIDWLPGFASGAVILAWNFHARALGQVLDRLGKVQVVVVHDEAERVAACAAAEAVVELLVGTDAERRGLFLVERAAGRVVLAGLFQLDTRTHHFNDVGAVEQIVNEGLRYQAGHKGMRIRSRSMARK